MTGLAGVSIMEANQRPKRSKKRLGRIFGALIGLFSVGLLVNWWALAQEEPLATMPTVPMPDPNAYDFYIAAGQARTQSKPIDAIRKKPTVPRTPEEETELVRIEAMIQQEAPALQQLHQGFAYEYRNPPSAPGAPHREYSVFRGIARLLAMQSRARAARGDWNGAAESSLDAIRMGEDIPRGGALNAAMVGITCQAIGQSTVWDTVDHLNAAQSRAAAQRLQSMIEKRCTYADTMQEEKWLGEAARSELLHKVRLRTALSTANSFSEPNSTTSQHYVTALYLLYVKKLILHNYLTYMDQLAVVCRQSYGLHLPPPPLPSDPINKTLGTVYFTSRLSSVRVETQNNLLLVALLLHAFRLEHGRYPTALTELAPAYLKRLPDDPFAPQGTFHYLLTGSDYVLYSVGPDGKDDEGTPIDDPQQANSTSGRRRYQVFEDSRGDIVAGINRP